MCLKYASLPALHDVVVVVPLVTGSAPNVVLTHQQFWQANRNENAEVVLWAPYSVFIQTENYRPPPRRGVFCVEGLRLHNVLHPWLHNGNNVPFSSRSYCVGLFRRHHAKTRCCGQISVFGHCLGEWHVVVSMGVPKAISPPSTLEAIASLNGHFYWTLPCIRPELYNYWKHIIQLHDTEVRTSRAGYSKSRLKSSPSACLETRPEIRRATTLEFPDFRYKTRLTQVASQDAT